MAFAPQRIHGGGARIFLGVTPGASGTPPTYITHTDGVPATGVEAGLTQGDTIYRYKAETKLIEAEQSLLPVEAMTTAEAGSMEFTCLEQTYTTLQRAFGTTGSETVAGGDAFFFGNGTGVLNPRTECVMITARQRNAPTKFIVAVLYRAVSMQGFEMPFKRNGESVYKVMVQALADLTRNAGDQGGYYRFET